MAYYLTCTPGLRTLCLAYKNIPLNIYEAWADRYHEATVALDDREEKIDTVSAEIEEGLTLLGATAIEDKLQDGVPDTIADLKRAGIKVWVLTGDKLETAIGKHIVSIARSSHSPHPPAIGYSTNLVAKDSNLIVVRGGDDGQPSAGDQMLEAVEQFFPESNIVETVRAKGFERPSPEKLGERPDMTRNRTGLSEFIGNNNGDRPGGYILVIDGNALGHVSASLLKNNMFAHFMKK